MLISIGCFHQELWKIRRFTFLLMTFIQTPTPSLKLLYLNVIRTCSSFNDEVGLQSDLREITIGFQFLK